MHNLSVKTDYTTLKGNFLMTYAAGEINIRAGIRIFAKMISSLKTGNQYRMLIDVRDSKSELNLPDVYDFLERLSIYNRLLKDKMAILVGNHHNADIARFFEIAAQSRGFKIRVFFHDFESAMKWLIAWKSRQTNEKLYPSFAPFFVDSYKKIQKWYIYLQHC